MRKFMLGSLVAAALVAAPVAQARSSWSRHATPQVHADRSSWSRPAVGR